MNISVTLNAEQIAALDDLLAGYNANRDTPVTATVYLETVLTGIINDKVKQRFDATATALVNATRQLPYETRQALIAQVQSAVTQS